MVLLLSYHFFQVLDFFLHRQLQILPLLLAHGASFINLLNLHLNLPVLVIQLVSLRAKCVHVVNQSINLFLCLDKRVHNFINGLDTCCLLNLIECILNNFDVSKVLIHKTFLLLVSGHDFGQTEFQNLNGVLVISGFVTIYLLSLIKCFIFKCQRLFLLVKFLLHFNDFALEVIFVLLMLSS